MPFKKTRGVHMESSHHWVLQLSTDGAVLSGKFPSGHLHGGLMHLNNANISPSDYGETSDNGGWVAYTSTESIRRFIEKKAAYHDIDIVVKKNTPQLTIAEGLALISRYPETPFPLDPQSIDFRGMHESQMVYISHSAEEAAHASRILLALGAIDIKLAATNFLWALDDAKEEGRFEHVLPIKSGTEHYVENHFQKPEPYKILRQNMPVAVREETARALTFLQDETSERESRNKPLADQIRNNLLELYGIAEQTTRDIFPVQVRCLGLNAAVLKDLSPEGQNILSEHPEEGVHTHPTKPQRSFF